MTFIIEWRGYPREEYQGHCPYCDAETFPFFSRRLKSGKQLSRTEKDFKNVVGYSTDCLKKENIIILLECPRCFEKSHCHVPDSWLEEYGRWLKNIDRPEAGVAGKEEEDGKK